MRLIHAARTVQTSSAGVSFRAGDGLAGLEGSLVALVTPFRDGHVDDDALSALCERQVQRGSAGLVVCGSTGEAPALLADEHMRVVGIAAEAVAGRIPVIAGCGAPSTDTAVALARVTVRSGADALMCAPPPYVRPTQDGIVAHIRAVADAACCPVILYDVPGRTGVSVSDATVARLHGQGMICGLKDAAGDLSRPVRLRALCGEGLLQVSGDDATAGAYRAMGGHGCISVTANLLPALCARMHRAWTIGDLQDFARLRDLLAPLHLALQQEANPIPVKAALSLAGLCRGDLRLPLTRATTDTLDRLAALLPDLFAAEEDAARAPRLSVVV